jgi:acyl-CoA thioester hydrolase
MAQKHRTRLQVRSYEVDFYGHVNNAVYLNYLEYARMKSLEDTGRSFREYMKEDVFIVIARIDIQYKGSAYMGDWLEVETSIKRVGNTSLVLQQDIVNVTQQKRIVEAEVTCVFVNREQRPIPIPQKFLHQLGWEKGSAGTGR